MCNRNDNCDDVIAVLHTIRSQLALASSGMRADIAMLVASIRQENSKRPGDRARRGAKRRGGLRVVDCE